MHLIASIVANRVNFLYLRILKHKSDMGAYGDENSPKEVMILLAKNIVVLRKQKKMSQRELSERSGVAYASVRKFESTGIISLESLLKICEALQRLIDFESILIPTDMEQKMKLFDY